MYAKRIHLHHHDLVETLTPDDIIPRLSSLQCLSRQEREQLKLEEKKGYNAHNNLLLEILLKKDPNLNVLEKFVTALESSGKTELADKLKHDLTPDTVLSKEDIRTIQSHYEAFVTEMRTLQVLQILLKISGYFNTYEEQELRAKTTDKARAQYLLDQVIFKGSYRQLDQFKDALLKTGQSKLACYLPVRSVSIPVIETKDKVSLLIIVSRLSDVFDLRSEFITKLMDGDHDLRKRLVISYSLSDISAEAIEETNNKLILRMSLKKPSMVHNIRTDIGNGHLVKVMKQYSYITDKPSWNIDIKEYDDRACQIPATHQFQYTEERVEKSLQDLHLKERSIKTDSAYGSSSFGKHDSGIDSEGASARPFTDYYSTGSTADTGYDTGISTGSTTDDDIHIKVQTSKSSSSTAPKQQKPKAVIEKEKPPTSQEIFVAKRTIFAIIEDKNHTAFDFWKRFSVYRKRGFFTAKNLVSEYGLNILHESLDKGRLSYLIPIIHTGWWKLLSTQKVPAGSLSEHRDKTAKQIAETKKARKPSDEFNNTNEWENSLSPLMKACRNGDVSKAKQLMRNMGQELYHTDYNGGNALYWTIVSGNEELFNLLADMGVDTNMRTKKKESLLHIACMTGQSHMVPLLLTKYGLNPLHEDINHKTALDRISENGDIETLKEFLYCSVKPQPNSLAVSAYTGRKPYVTYLIEDQGMDVDSTDLYGRTGLQRACEGGKTDIAKYLVNQRSRLDLHTKMGRNVLHIIAEQGNLQLSTWMIAQLQERNQLIKLINVQDRYNGVDLCFLIRGRDKGRDAWHYVEVDRNKVPIFLEKTKCGNVDVALFGKVIKSGWGVNPDEAAVDEIEELFKMRRLDQNAPTDMTPLHIALAKGNYEIAKIFIDKGADIHIKDKFGLTPLMIAVSKGNLEMISLLEKSGASFKDVSKEGKTLQEIADDNEHQAVVNYVSGRDSNQLVDNFVAGPLKVLENALSKSTLEKVSGQGGDVKRHMIDSLRHLTTDINQVLIDLGSGPVQEESDPNTSSADSGYFSKVH